MCFFHGLLRSSLFPSCFRRPKFSSSRLVRAVRWVTVFRDANHTRNGRIPISVTNARSLRLEHNRRLPGLSCP